MRRLFHVVDHHQAVAVYAYALAVAYGSAEQFHGQYQRFVFRMTAVAVTDAFCLAQMEAVRPLYDAGDTALAGIGFAGTVKPRLPVGERSVSV